MFATISGIFCQKYLNDMNKIISSVFVLGSTSSVAESICIELAKRGCKRFHLVVRDIKKNKNLISILKINLMCLITQESMI